MVATADRPIPQPPDPQTVAQVRKYLEALPDCPYEVVAGGMDDDGKAYVELREKT